MGEGAAQGDGRATERILSDEPFYTIGQVATLLGVPAAQLRRLDAFEIVQPDRSQGNQRRYSADEIERLREVLRLGEEGVSLPGVRRILELRRRVDELEDRLARQSDELAAARRMARGS
ncbi:MerR family transcriptional regulator [Microbacterium sp. Marseille-Q6965]|uniref:MerR family transcriptional regulator n=1 Tax=Microbacterium sp. Marseille-Q6965 TaxID=2965072 RepID=UPI0021B72E63|nr:MerR family transcriptional regulator [Microbacterium sp. Marseille-Q6965]